MYCPRLGFRRSFPPNRLQHREHGRPARDLCQSQAGHPCHKDHCVRTDDNRESKTFMEARTSDPINSLTWLTDLHLEFCSHRTRNQLYHAINHAAGEIVVITGDLSAGPHRLAQYTELAEQIRKPVYFVLGNHDRYGTTFANTETVVGRVTALFSHMVRLNGSQIIPLSHSVALIGVDGWADGLGGEGPETKARINDFYQIIDFATDPEPQVFREMKERAGKYSRALRPSLIRALKQYQTTIIATHVPPYEGAAWHEGSPSSPAYQPFFSSPTMGKMIKAAVAEHPGKKIGRAHV